jgi:hypothetical protein
MMSRVLIPAVLACTLGACSSVDLTGFRAPSLDSNYFSLGTTSVYRGGGPARPVGPNDLVDAEGRCAGEAPAQVDNSLEPGLAAQPAAPRGVALQMTECEVARALGQAQRVDVVPGASGERSVVMSYTLGERAGVYRFQSGRLVSVERGAEPPPPPPVAKQPAKKKTAKKPANA